jgi:RimJ/RimL family protein N-acetyltransferase
MEALIETERLRLRAIGTRDGELITRFLAEYDVSKMLATVPHPYTRAHLEEFLARDRAAAASQTSLVLAIDCGGLIGMMGLSDIQTIEGERTATLGYWIGRPFWGRGFASEAAHALVDHAFAQLGFAGLKSGHFKENPASGRVLAKLGFRAAGESLRHSLARNADVAHVDVVLTRARWEELAFCGPDVRELVAY